MIPNKNSDSDIGIEIVRQPSETYKVNFKDGRAFGYTNGIEAVKQAIYKIIYTERYEYAIYSWNYGIELSDLHGRLKDYVYSELARRLTEALLQDDRITAVENFAFTANRKDVAVTFTVNTIYGELEVQREVTDIV